MSGEISLSFNLVVSKGTLNDAIQRSQTLDMITGRGGCPGFKRVGTTHELIDLGDLVAPRFMFVENLDSTNFIEYGTIGEEIAGTSTIFIPWGTVYAGESFVVPVPADCPALWPLYVKADTATCSVVIRVYDT